TGVGFVDAVDQFEESRLPRAVCADQADFFGGIDLEADVSKYVLRTERLRDAVKLYDHGKRLLRSPLLCRYLARVLQNLHRFVPLAIFVPRGLFRRRLV